MIRYFEIQRYLIGAIRIIVIRHFKARSGFQETKCACVGNYFVYTPIELKYKALKDRTEKDSAMANVGFSNKLLTTR